MYIFVYWKMWRKSVSFKDNCKYINGVILKSIKKTCNIKMSYFCKYTLSSSLCDCMIFQWVSFQTEHITDFCLCYVCLIAIICKNVYLFLVLYKIEVLKNHILFYCIFSVQQAIEAHMLKLFDSLTWNTRLSWFIYNTSFLGYVRFTSLGTTL